MTSYDRIFETHNLTSEMVKGTGHGQQLSFFESLRKLYGLKKDQLGQCFVQYLQPIHLKQWLEKRGALDLDSPETHKTIAFKLSKDLYQVQQKATPVTLNSLVAAVLLSTTQEQMPI